MRRREFITLLGGAAVAWPVAARAQQMRQVGILITVPDSDQDAQRFLASFQRRLQELGWVDGRNVRFERRYAGGDPERMRANIAEIVGLAPDAILAQNTPMVAALRKQTTTIPIVFVQVSDPVGDGFVESLARPGSNATGFANTMASLGGKWVELLKEVVPAMSQVGYLFNRAAAPGGGTYYMEPLLKAAAALGLKVAQLELKNETEIDDVISGFAAAGGNGMVANSDSFITVHRIRIIAAANRLRLPTMYSSADRTKFGGLISYGADTEQQWQAAANYIDRILRGETASGLPVQLPTKFILSINLRTAKTIGLKLPESFLLRADEVIE